MPKNAKNISTKPIDTKAARIANLLQRKNSSTIVELAKATGWQQHSVHGFMSGTLKKKHGLEIKSTKEVDKERRYRIDGGKQ